MKRIRICLIALLVAFMSLESCGPVIISSRPSHPTPPWFYPNRVVNVRYIYFPEYTIYYDLTLRNYLYFENNVWIRVNVLPSRYNGLDFRRARQVRVQNYFGDNIRTYHSTRASNTTGRRTSSSRNRN